MLLAYAWAAARTFCQPQLHVVRRQRVLKAASAAIAFFWLGRRRRRSRSFVAEAA